MNKLKILILDRNEMFRKGISKLLIEAPLIEKVKVSDNIEAAINVVEDQIIDVLIMDTNIINLDPSSFIKKIQTIKPDLKIIILTRDLEINKVVEMIKLGVSSYLLKSTSLIELQNAIKVVMSGESYFPKEVSSIIFQHLANPIPKPSSENIGKTALTCREKEILEYISKEYTNKEIASMLFISRRTVDTHRRNLLLKLDVKNTAGLVRYYYNNLYKNQRESQKQ